MRIENVSAATFERVLPLIADYQRFYQVEPDEARNRAHFGRLLDRPNDGVQFIAVDDVGAALGFATLYFPLNSLRASATAVMFDLFTIDAARGKGVGKALIERCAAYAGEHGFGSISWETALDNVTAQRLYDRMGAERSGWYEYTLATRLQSA